MFSRKKNLNDQILEFNYPYADKKNSILLSLIKANSNVPIAKGGCLRSSTNLHKKGIVEIDNLIKWIEDLIPPASLTFVDWDGTDITLGTGGRGGYDPYSFEIDTCWGMYYGEGSGCVEHNNFPYPIGFVYYVSVPQGSSPTIMGGQRLNPKEGQLLMFMGHHYHGVPISKVDGRCIIAGLISYKIKDV